ncbi:hypothetical protein OSTOST_07287 [Ostertagia ostertagi]
MLAYPGFKVGSVQLVSLNNMSECASLSPRGIDAHLTEITQLALNNQTTLLATEFSMPPPLPLVALWSFVAEQIHVHSTVCSSLRAHVFLLPPGTIHIFAIRDSDDAKRGILHKVGLSKGEKRSAVQISLEPRVLACGFIKASSSSMQSVVAICQDGSYHRFSFGADGSTKREGFDYVMQLGDEQEFWTKPF